MKNKKVLFGIIGFVVVIVTAVVLGLFLHKDKKEVTAENFKVDQGNGVFYLNGGYMILETKDKCKYLEYETQKTYDAHTYIYNETAKALYIFVAGSVDDMKYGANESELYKKLEEKFAVKPVKQEVEKYKSGTWKHAKMKNHVDAGEQVCDVDAYYQFKEGTIYMVLIYSDSESKNETKLLDKLTLKDKPIVTYKNETPVKINDAGYGTYKKTMEETDYEMLFPQSVVENSFFQEYEQYVSFDTNDGAIITCRASKVRENIEGHYANTVELGEGADITYDAFEYEDGRHVEYEYCIYKEGEEYAEYRARVQITKDDAYYILDISGFKPITDMKEYIKDYDFN